ncbi:MAG: bifunctional alpha/beta hydrolase/class I SAM-dependent methyltransferase [Planctomycetota bacterium]
MESTHDRPLDAAVMSDANRDTQALPRAKPTFTESAFTSWDGTELYYRHWAPAGPSTKALVMFHRGHEHSGRFLDVVEALGLHDTHVFAWDARGHGKSPGRRGYAPSFGGMVRDVDAFVNHLKQAHGLATRDMVVLAHSVGAVTVASWVHSHAPVLRGLVLATPALRVRLYVPLAVPGLRLLQKLRGDRPTFVKSYVKSTMLTHDAAQAAAYDADPLIARSIAVNVLLGLHDAGTRLLDDAGAITTPTLMLAGGSDAVVSVKAQKRFFDRLGSDDKTMHVFDGMYHDVLHEEDRGPVLDAIRGFVERRFAEPAEPTSLLDADARGHTFDEFTRLQTPLTVWSPKRCFFTAQNAALRTLGRTSRGVRLGFDTGFDSGASLDYVYENRAQGSLGIGKLIDRAYLDAVGWRGIRKRREHLRELIRDAIGRVRDERSDEQVPVRLLDIAAGCGRYTLEAVAEVENPAPVSVALRDLDPANLEEAKRHAERLGVDDVTATPGDAFDGAQLAGLDPRPDVAVVSGLYELFPENGPVLGSLRGLASAVPAGGYLVYTGQPWHPQVEMIARCLPSHLNRAWVMRRRTQAELDQLVAAAGFEKVRTLVDEWGIFTVSLARRVGS